METTPWLTLAEAAAYVRRGRRALARDVKLGRAKAAVVGGKGQLLFRREWLDAYVEAMSTPVLLTARRRA